jgi:succinate dehydrogenase / fumarate reductase, cytochrome b subunit
MKTERPVYLSLTEFRWPIAAMSSISHRMTGVILFVAPAYLLWLLGMAVASPSGFDRAAAIMAEPLAKLAMIALLGVLAFHIFAGFKHLVMDFHHWDGLDAGRRAAIGVFVLTAVATVLAGVWIW